MKKVWILLLAVMLLLIGGCGGKDAESVEAEPVADLGSGDINKSGDVVGKLTLHKFIEVNAKENIYALEYAYENTGDENGLYVSSTNFTLIDAEGNVCEYYPIADNKLPQDIPVGSRCLARERYIIKTDTVKLAYGYYGANTEPDEEIVFENLRVH